MQQTTQIQARILPPLNRNEMPRCFVRIGPQKATMSTVRLVYLEHQLEEAALEIAASNPSVAYRETLQKFVSGRACIDLYRDGAEAQDDVAALRVGNVTDDAVLVWLAGESECVSLSMGDALVLISTLSARIDDINALLKRAAERLLEDDPNEWVDDDGICGEDWR